MSLLIFVPAAILAAIVERPAKPKVYRKRDSKAKTFSLLH